MSKFGLVMVMMLMAGRTNAQNYPAPSNDPLTYFVLIESDDGQAFFVRLNNQLYSSSLAGHLILSQLRDSLYTISIGFSGQFSGQSLHEQRFLVNIHEKDQALHLVRRENRYELSDGQGQALATVADSTGGQRPLMAGVKKDDAFSQMMAAIVQDTAVMYNTYVDAAPDSSLAAVTVDPAPVKTIDSVKIIDSASASAPSASSASSASSAPSAPTGVIKLSERKSTQSFSLVFADHPDAKTTDTIDVVIPVDTAAHHPALTDTAQSHKSALPFVNSDCHAFATDNDVDKLRIRMLAAPKDDDRIQVAYKIFKTKCFATDQVRALTEMFTSDAAKFKFLATAYPFVSDDHFPELAGLLTDPVYAEKFRNMTDHH